MEISHLMPLASILILASALFFLFGSEPFSFDAYIRPFTGDFAAVSLVLLTIGILDLIYLNIAFIPKLVQDPKNHVLALTMSTPFSIFGFVIGFLDRNPWVALPFFAIALGNYLLVYQRVSKK